MTVCKFFLQGTCRFGERCRFEHIENSYDSYDAHRNVGHQYGQPNTQHYQNKYEYNNYYRNQRSTSPDGYSENYRSQAAYGTYRNDNYDNNYYNQKQRNYSQDRYTENYRYESPSAYSSGNYRNNKYDYNYQNQRSHSQDRYSENYRNQPQNEKHGYEEYSQYQEHTHGRNKQYQNSNYQRDDTYGQNKFKWLSNDYKKQNEPKTHSNSDVSNEAYSTSTPKGKSSFSFKLPESEIKKASFSGYEVDENDQIRAELVKEDAKAWELGGLWPFTCYCPIPEKHCFPGFCDVSPEELRFAAYKAEENNAYESYVQSVQTALMQINQQRSQLQIPTPQLLATLRRVWDGENLCCTPGVIATIPFLQCDETSIDVMDTPSSNVVSTFSFKIDSEADSSVKPSTPAAAFSFKLPAANETKVPASGFSGDPEVYTPLENLTEEEKDQFSASTFILGKIPTKPPPQMLCT